MCQENVYGAKKFIKFKKFQNKNWSPSAMNKLITKIDQAGNLDCKPSSGKEHKTRIAQNVDSADELVLSLENALGTQKTGILKISVHRTAKQELTLQCEAVVL